MVWNRGRNTDREEVQRFVFYAMIVTPHIARWVKVIPIDFSPHSDCFVARDVYKARLVITVCIRRGYKLCRIRREAPVNLDIRQSDAMVGDLSSNRQSRLLRRDRWRQGGCLYADNVRPDPSHAIAHGRPGGQDGQYEAHALPHERRQAQVDGMVLTIVLFALRPKRLDRAICSHVIQLQSDITAIAIFTANTSTEMIPGLDGEGWINSLDVTVVSTVGRQQQRRRGTHRSILQMGVFQWSNEAFAITFRARAWQDSCAAPPLRRAGISLEIVSTYMRRPA